MASSIHFAGNSYAGEVLEDLLHYAANENDTAREGLIHIKSGVQAKYTLPHVSLGQIIQDNVPTPTSTHGQATEDKNNYVFSERHLEPKDFMVYLEFNPRDFEQYWRPFQPTGELIFRELDPKVQATMLRLLLDKKDEYIGDCIWGAKKGGPDATYVSDSSNNTVLGGTAAAGPMKYFDGFMVRVLDNITNPSAAEKATGQVVLAGSTALTTGAQIEQALYTMYQKCPKSIRKSKNLKFVMGWELWDLYDQYLTGKDVKYSENADVNKFRFKGKRIVVINGITEQTIALGKFSSAIDSCLWMGVDYATDQDSIKVEKLQANSELYFFQMRMKMDVNIVKPSEIVVWTTYKISGE